LPPYLCHQESYKSNENHSYNRKSPDRRGFIVKEASTKGEKIINVLKNIIYSIPPLLSPEISVEASFALCIVVVVDVELLSPRIIVDIPDAFIIFNNQSVHISKS